MPRLFPVFPAIAALLALLSGLAAPPALAADAAAALERARILAEESHAALALDGGAGERADALRTAFETSFAVDFWEKFLIRNHAESFPADRLAEFRALLPGFLAGLYANRFDGARAAKPRIGEARKARGDILVRTAIPRADGDPLPVDWRVHDFGARGHLVVDFIIGGASFLLLQRDEFDGILESGGPDALLAHMRRNAV